LAHGDTHSTSAASRQKCQILEILQYTCDIKKKAKAADPASNARAELRCFPVPRIFRMCPNRPAIEITRYVSIDPATGEVILPPDTNAILPKGKPWWDTVRLPEDQVSTPKE